MRDHSTLRTIKRCGEGMIASACMLDVARFGEALGCGCRRSSRLPKALRSCKACFRHVGVKHAERSEDATNLENDVNGSRFERAVDGRTVGERPGVTVKEISESGKRNKVAHSSMYLNLGTYIADVFVMLS